MHPGSQTGLAPLGLKLDVSPALLRWMNEQLQRQEASSQLGGLFHLSTERFGKAIAKPLVPVLRPAVGRAESRQAARSDSAASSDLKPVAVLPLATARCNANQVVTGEWEVRPCPMVRLHVQRVAPFAVSLPQTAPCGGSMPVSAVCPLGQQTAV